MHQAQAHQAQAVAPPAHPENQVLVDQMAALEGERKRRRGKKVVKAVKGKVEIPVMRMNRLIWVSGEVEIPAMRMNLSIWVRHVRCG